MGGLKGKDILHGNQFSKKDIERMMKREFPLFGYNPVTGEWNDSLTGEFLWSNVNLSEAVPEVMTPGTWSLWWIFHYESNPIVFPGNHPFCGNICGRPYFNLSLLFSVYRAVGRDARRELQGDLINSIPPDMEIPFLPFSAFLVYRTVLPGTFKAGWQMRQSQRDMARFLETTPAWCTATRAEVVNWKDAHSLLLGWQAKLKPFILQACQILRTVTAELAGPATRLRTDLSNLVGETDANTILSSLSGPSGNLASMGPLLGLSQVARGKMSRETYLECYGHRGPHEMELSASGAEEDPAWLDKQLEQLAGMPMEITLAKQRAEQAEPGRDSKPTSPTLLPPQGNGWSRLQSRPETARRCARK